MISILSRAGRHLPPIRRLVEARDAALTKRDIALAQRDMALAERDVALAERDVAPTTEALRRVMGVVAPDTYFYAKLNGYPVWLPRGTLRTMIHCAHWEADGSLSLWVETAHLAWMMERLNSGGTFLDVGAATGATTLPVMMRFGDEVSVIAYEPSTTARDLLIGALARNGIDGVTVRPLAISDMAGSIEFLEYGQDETGVTPWQPETSSLTSPLMSSAPHRKYDVRVVTLDEDALPHCGKPLVVKIDVEGFEAHVLRGAQRLIKDCRPYLSIDIHADPFGDGLATTEAAVTALLQGYQFERLAHVLLCTPP